MFIIGGTVTAIGIANTIMNARATDSIKASSVADAGSKDALMMTTLGTGLGIGATLFGAALIGLTILAK